jgi:hypothetical protein
MVELRMFVERSILTNSLYDPARCGALMQRKPAGKESLLLEFRA